MEDASTLPYTPDSEHTLVSQEHIYKNIIQFNKQEGSTYSIVWRLISSLSLNSDITSITCPAFLVRPFSMLEMCSECIAPCNLTQIGELSDPKDRLLAVTKSMFACCTVAPKENMYNCKPFNPILGERFQCEWNHQDGSTTKFFAEQVSHHPPISACMLYNKKSGFKNLFITKPQSYFRGNYVEVDMPGQSILTLENFDEEYVITMPPLFVRGILWGHGNVEHGKSFSIQCKKTKAKVEIQFLGGSKICGDVKIGDEKMTFKGDTFGKVHLSDNTLLYDYNALDRPKKMIKPLVEQDSMESRRVWHRAAYGIVTNNDDQASKAKNEVEERQRELRRLGVKPDMVWFKGTEEVSGGVPVYEFIGPQ
jgi:hypothetical protein